LPADLELYRMIIAAREKDFALTAAFGCFVRKECRLAVKRELAIDDFEYGWTLYPRATG
jgi:hypothetical protein